MTARAEVPKLKKRKLHMNGIVKNFSPELGYGFIHPLAGGGPAAESVFFHLSAVATSRPGVYSVPPVGAEVKFKLARGNGKHRIQAAEVELIELDVSSLRKKPVG